jgi:hypothetical protein
MSVTLAVAVAAIVIVAFFALVVLGMMRELSIARTETDALMRILTSPAPPTFLADQMPDAIRRQLPSPNGRHRHVLLALSESCGSCSDFLASIEDGGADRESLTCVVRVSSAESPLAQLARRVAGTVIVDEKGDLFDKLQVTVTPAMFAIDARTGTVVGNKVGPDSVWLDTALDHDHGTALEEAGDAARRVPSI